MGGGSGPAHTSLTVRQRVAARSLGVSFRPAQAADPSSGNGISTTGDEAKVGRALLQRAYSGGEGEKLCGSKRSRGSHSNLSSTNLVQKRSRSWSEARSHLPSRQPPGRTGQGSKGGRDGGVGGAGSAGGGLFAALRRSGKAHKARLKAFSRGGGREEVDRGVAERLPW